MAQQITVTRETDAQSLIGRTVQSGEWEPCEVLTAGHFDTTLTDAGGGIMFGHLMRVYGIGNPSPCPTIGVFPYGATITVL